MSLFIFITTAPAFPKGKPKKHAPKDCPCNKIGVPKVHPYFKHKIHHRALVAKATPQVASISPRFRSTNY